VLKISRILRDYREAGSVNSLLALWGFVDETTFLTKAGHVGVVYRVRGIDAEGLTHSQRAAMVHRFEAALRLLDDHCRVYQYLLKRTTDPIVSAPCAQPVANEAIQERAAYLNGRRSDLYELGLYLVVVYEVQLAPAPVRNCGICGARRRPRSAAGCLPARHSRSSKRNSIAPLRRFIIRRRRSRCRWATSAFSA
jgi:type IV secretory pathway VirB4 component